MLNILVAYPYYRKLKDKTLEDFADPEIRVIIDSGAFTAWKSGKPIRIEEYMDFLRGLKVQPWRYFTLDEIGNGEITKKNYYTLLENGFKPVPIFTRGEDIKMIDEYFETSDVVAIGGLVGTKNNKGFVKAVLNAYPDKKFHLLGFTSHDYITHFKPYMCDSNSWCAGAMYKTMRLYMGRGKFKSLDKKDFMKRPSPEVIQRLQFYDIDYRKLAYESGWVTKWTPDQPLEMIICRSYIHYQAELSKRYDINYFLVGNNSEINTCLIENYRSLKAKGTI